MSLAPQDLTAGPQARVVVLGDLNDGPGQDFFEEFFLTHSVTDTLVGTSFEPEQIFTHAQHDALPADRFSAIFDDFVENIQGKRLLLDHILLSPGFDDNVGLRRQPGTGTIEHAVYTGLVNGTGTIREDRPSDHRPASVSLFV